MIKIVNNFDLKGSLFSGQCFRMFEKDGYFYTIIKDRILKIKEEKEYYLIWSNNEDNLKEIVHNYFDLNRDYKKINKELVSKDSFLKEIINDKHRIFRQDKVEMFISYIISQNNNVKRISTSVNKLCELFGKKIIFENTEYYLFPSLDKLISLNIEDLNLLKIGFRDKYVINAINVLKKYRNFLEELDELNTYEAMELLTSIKVIGPKVASCILMFGFSRLDAYPIDTWAKKYLSKRYNISNLDELKKRLHDLYGDYVGLAIQYMYNYERNEKSTIN